jgi:glyoxylase-like metal-dependent hydrolase (beta-lactamase superfamily II)
LWTPAPTPAPPSTSCGAESEGLGHALVDIELVILTHQHIDHLGLVSLVVARSGAEVAAIDVAVPFVENYTLEADADDEFARDVMLRHGSRRT